MSTAISSRFCGAVQHATFAASDGPFARYAADLVVPEQAAAECALLKGVALRYVMRRDAVEPLHVRQRELLTELVAALLSRGPAALQPAYRADWAAAETKKPEVRGMRVESLDTGDHV